MTKPTTCKLCGRTYPEVKFPMSNGKLNSLTCNACRYAKYGRKEKHEYQQKHYQSSGRAWHYRNKYGIEDVEAFFSSGCVVCGSHERLCVDHDHATGKVRGCLCDNCNVALGRVQDNAVTLRKLADYLEVHCEKDCVH